MSFLHIWKAENSANRASLQSRFSFSNFLTGDFKSDQNNDPHFTKLQHLLEQLVQKIGAHGGFLAYYISGIQTKISVGKINHDYDLTPEEQSQLEYGNPVVKRDAYVYPIRRQNQFTGLIYLFRNAETWQPLSDELVQAYALLCAQNLQMEYEQNNLTKYANSLLDKKKELEKIQNYNQNLLSITTHDLSSPLNAVSGYLEMIDQCLEEDKSTQKLQKYHKQIQSGVSDVSDMLQQLSEVIKYKKGFLTLDKVTVDVNWIVNDICELLKANARKKDIELKAVPCERPIYIDVDIVKFKRIIYNLVSNAIKYTGRQKHIFVRIQADENNVQVQVKDEGIGISEDKLDKIFQPFVKLNKNEKGEDGCSQGLGLYISSYFVELMGGKILAQSKSGKGSTFTINLPRVAMATLQSQTG